MKFIPSIWVLYVFFLTGFLFPHAIQATTNSGIDTLQIQLAPLTKEKVRDYIKTSVAITQLQNKMKANASQYENLIKTFYQKRKELLESRGWTVEGFEETQSRVFATKNAIREEARLKSEEEFEKEIAEINASPYFTEEQKSGIIEVEQSLRRHALEEIIQPTKPDWPAVKAYQKELEHLSDYAASNRADPPVLK